MKERMNERSKEQTNELTIERMNACVTEWMNEKTKKLMKEWRKCKKAQRPPLRLTACALMLSEQRRNLGNHNWTK